MLLDKNGLEDWTFRFHSGNGNLGLISHQNKQIALSWHLTPRVPPEQVEEVLRHNIAHALAGPGADHKSPEWQKYAHQLGAQIQSCGTKSGFPVHEETPKASRKPAQYEQLPAPSLEPAVDQAEDIDQRSLEFLPELLTNEMRAELVLKTGHDIAPDDPILTLVHLNAMMLRSVGDELIRRWQQGTLATASALDDIRREALTSFRDDCLHYALKIRDSIKADQKEAGTNAAQIVAQLGKEISISRLSKPVLVLIVIALIVLGVLIGVGLRGNTNIYPSPGIAQSAVK